MVVNVTLTGAVATLVHAQLVTPALTVKHTTHVQTLLVRTEVHQHHQVPHAHAHAHVDILVQSVRLTQAHARTIHA